MATYTEKILKDGTVRVAIQAKITNPDKSIVFYHTTFKNQQGLKGKQALNAAIAYGVEWEKKIKAGIKEKPEFVEEPTFAWAAADWCRRKKHKHSDLHQLKIAKCIEVLNRQWGNKKIKDLTLREVEDFFLDFSDATYSRNIAVIKESAKEKLNNAVENYGVRKVSNEGIFSRPTLYNARMGKHIEWKVAEMICRKFGLNIYDTFDKVPNTKQYSKETIMSYKRVLSAIFNNAIRYKWATTNYALKIYIEDSIGGTKPEKIVVLNEAEIKDLFELLETKEIYEAIPIYLLVCTGMRKCELAGLSWENIDFDNGFINIENNRVYVPHKNIIFKDTKTEKSKRTIPIIDLLFEKLVKYRQFYENISKADPEFSSSNAVFCNLDGTPRNPNYVNTILKRFLLDADVRVVSSHKMRHRWISKLMNSGSVAASSVSAGAGHSSIKVTLDRYTHRDPDIDNLRFALNDIYKKPNPKQVSYQQGVKKSVFDLAVNQ